MVSLSIIIFSVECVFYLLSPHHITSVPIQLNMCNQISENEKNNKKNACFALDCLRTDSVCQAQVHGIPSPIASAVA